MTTPPSGSNRFSDSTQRRKNLIGLAGLLALLLVINGIVGLFSLSYTNRHQQADIALLRESMQALETARSAQVYFKKQVQEWKNILLRGGQAEDFQRYRAAFDREEANVQQELQELEAAAGRLRLDLPLVAKVRQSHLELGPRYREALTHFQPDQPDAARIVDARVRGIDRAPTDDMDTIVEQIHVYADQEAVQMAERARTRYQTLRWVSIGTTAAGLVIVFIFLGVSFAVSRKT